MYLNYPTVDIEVNGEIKKGNIDRVKNALIISDTGDSPLEDEVNETKSENDNKEVKFQPQTQLLSMSRYRRTQRSPNRAPKNPEFTYPNY